MAKTFRNTVAWGLVGYYTNSDAVTEAYQRLNHVKRALFTSGSGDNQTDRLFVDPERTLSAAPTSYELDALTDHWGDVVSLAKVRFIVIESLTLTSGFTLAISGDFATERGMPSIIYPGGSGLMTAPVDGMVVTPDGSDTLTIDPGANEVKYNLFIGGNE